MIVLEKILHKGGSYIALRFEYNLEIKTKLKTLPGIKYSRTHRCWYIPNSWVVFEAFRKLGIEYEKKETNAKTTGTRLSPEKSENSCIAVLAANQSGPVKAGGKPGTDINPLKRGLKKIVWQGGFFLYA